MIVYLLHNLINLHLIFVIAIGNTQTYANKGEN